jgi:hypothetical protein
MVFFVKTVPGFSKEAFLDGQYLLSSRGRMSFCSIQQESTFWRRSLWDVAGGRLDPRYGLAGDFDLWARFYEHSELISVPGTIAAFRTRDGQRSEDAEAYLHESERSLSEARSKMGWKPSWKRRAWLGLPISLRKARRRFGYLGKRAVRVKERTENATWVIDPYYFP